MRLSGQKAEIVIDGTHEKFKGTPYEGEDFKVTMTTETTEKLLSAVQARKEAQKRGLGNEGVVALAHGMASRMKMAKNLNVMTRTKTYSLMTLFISNSLRFSELFTKKKPKQKTLQRKLSTRVWTMPRVPQVAL